MSSGTAESEIVEGQRFGFGRNWSSFLRVIDDNRIASARRSIAELVGGDDLTGRSFLDVGCGSGLFSLAATRMGARRVHSFDFDPESVGCAVAMRDRFACSFDHWTIEQGSALDDCFLARLGQFDVVYAWGVLHHTGDMWKALSLMPDLVTAGGQLVLAIYNRQPWSPIWKHIKRLYCSGAAGRAVVLGTMIPLYVTAYLHLDVLQGRNPLGRYRDYKKQRGMSRIHDWKDWLGGYPFEVATPDDVVVHFENRGFRLEHLDCVRGYGCNQFAFRKRQDVAEP